MTAAVSDYIPAPLTIDDVLKGILVGAIKARCRGAL